MYDSNGESSGERHLLANTRLDAQSPETVGRGGGHVGEGGIVGGMREAYRKACNELQPGGSLRKDDRPRGTMPLSNITDG